MTHTPGPWRQPVADYIYHPDPAIARANQRLIAAAPDMLEALKTVDTEGRNANRNGDVIIPSHIWDLIQQAIAKAEGRT